MKRIANVVGIAIEDQLGVAVVERDHQFVVLAAHAEVALPAYPKGVELVPRIVEAYGLLTALPRYAV